MERLIYAIGDLHLSFYTSKPMSIFGAAWENHAQKIKQNWEKVITDEDFCIIPGDISWAMKLEEAVIDLRFIDELPGRKILLPGNHDFWWDSASKLNSMFKTMTFIKNSFAPIGEVAVCGSRGWVCPNDSSFTKHDKKIYLRELGRIETSLRMAKEKGFDNILLALHFPPTNDKKDRSDIICLIEKYGVKSVIYGHLHGNCSYNASLLGTVDGRAYSLVSSDYLGFKPKRIE